MREQARKEDMTHKGLVEVTKEYYVCTASNISYGLGFCWEHSNARSNYKGSQMSLFLSKLPVY